ncbi:MAG: hypothetical protein AB8B55_22380 [Mariniblastus sp.]
MPISAKPVETMKKQRKKPVNDSQVIDDLDLGNAPPPKRSFSRKKTKKRYRGKFEKRTKPEGFQWAVAAWSLLAGAVVSGIFVAWIFWG